MYTVYFYHTTSTSTSRPRRELLGRYETGDAVAQALDTFKDKLYWQFMRKYGLVCPDTESDPATGDDVFYIRPALMFCPVHMWRIHVDYRREV